MSCNFIILTKTSLSLSHVLNTEEALQPRIGFTERETCDESRQRWEINGGIWTHGVVHGLRSHEGWPSNFKGWEIRANLVKPWRWFDETLTGLPRMTEVDLLSMVMTLGATSLCHRSVCDLGSVQRRPANWPIVVVGCTCAWTVAAWGEINQICSSFMNYFSHFKFKELKR